MEEPCTILNARIFDGGRIFEISFNMQPGTEKEEKYQWVLILENKRFFLDFISADFSKGTRVLKYKDIIINLSLNQNTLSIQHPDHIDHIDLQ